MFISDYATILYLDLHVRGENLLRDCRMIECKNCGTAVNDKYCPHCGQKAGVKRISLGDLLKDLPHAIFHVDNGILYNVHQLFKRPGAAINDYMNGKRKPFYHPASFLLISLILNFLIVKIIDLHFYDGDELTTMDAITSKAILDYDAMQWWFLEHTYIYILLAIPASALFLFCIFHLCKKEFNIAESVVVVLFTIAQGVLIQSFIYASFGWVKSGPFIRTVETFNICILVTYASWVIYQLLPEKKSKAVRTVTGFIAGLGLAVVWIASAYGLYLVIG